MQGLPAGESASLLPLRLGLGRLGERGRRREGGTRGAAERLGRARAAEPQRAARGAAVEMVDRDTMATMTGSPIYHGGWMNRSGGHIQPLSYARGLAHAAILAGASVRCQSPALEIRREDGCWRILTPRGTVDADTISL